MKININLPIFEAKKNDEQTLEMLYVVCQLSTVQEPELHPSSNNRLNSTLCAPRSFTNEEGERHYCMLQQIFNNAISKLGSNFLFFSISKSRATDD